MDAQPLPQQRRIWQRLRPTCLMPAVGKPQPAAGAAALSQSQSQGLLAVSHGFTPLSPTPASCSSMGLTFSRWGPRSSSVESSLPWFLHYGHLQLSTRNAKLCSQSPRHSFLDLDYDLGNLSVLFYLFLGLKTTTQIIVE